MVVSFLSLQPLVRDTRLWMCPQSVECMCVYLCMCVCAWVYMNEYVCIWVCDCEWSYTVYMKILHIYVNVCAWVHVSMWECLPVFVCFVGVACNPVNVNACVNMCPYMFLTVSEGMLYGPLCVWYTTKVWMSLSISLKNAHLSLCIFSCVFLTRQTEAWHLPHLTFS